MEFELSRQFIQNLVAKSPKLEAPIRHIYTLANDIKMGHGRNRALIIELVEALNHKSEIIAEHASELLHKLSITLTQVQEELSKASSVKNTQTQYWLLASIGKFSNADLKKKILTDSLNNESRKIKSRAAEIILKLHFTDIIPVLTKICESEEDMATKKSLSYTLGLLRDGYILEERDVGIYSLTVKDDKSTYNKLVSKEELMIKGIDRLKMEMIVKNM